MRGFTTSKTRRSQRREHPGFPGASSVCNVRVPGLIQVPTNEGGGTTGWGDDGVHAIVGELALRLHQLLALGCAAIEEAGVDLPTGGRGRGQHEGGSGRGLEAERHGDQRRAPPPSLAIGSSNRNPKKQEMNKHA
eukprot:10210-Prorocentrum_minimum.AAC.7